MTDEELIKKAQELVEFYGLTDADLKILFKAYDLLMSEFIKVAVDD